MVLKEHSSSDGLLIQSIVYDTCMYVQSDNFYIFSPMCSVPHLRYLQMFAGSKDFVGLVLFGTSGEILSMYILYCDTSHG